MNPRRNIQAHRQRRRRMVMSHRAEQERTAKILNEPLRIDAKVSRMMGDTARAKFAEALIASTFVPCICRRSDKGICTWCRGTRRMIAE